MMIPFLLIHLINEKPVMELDQMTIRGKVRKPSIIEVEKPRTQDKIEEVARNSLHRLERELTKPRTSDEIRKTQMSEPAQSSSASGLSK